MTKQELDRILIQVAAQNHTTVDNVRKEIQIAMDIAMNSPNPATRTKWAAIPHKGEKPTMEELIEYVVMRVKTIQALM